MLALSGVGGYYAYRALGGDGPSRAAATGGGDPLGPGDADPSADLVALEVSATEPGAPPAAIRVSPTLEVTSEPAGAAVSFDGQDSGETTPASFPLAAPYPETITLSLDGYESASRTMPPVDDELVAVAFELTREETFGRVVVSGSYPFEVWIGDRRIRDAAAEHNVGWNTGALTLRVRNAEYFLDRSLTVEVVEGRAARVSVPELGSLSVFSNPGNCEIFVGSQSLDYPPITQRAIAPGRYRVSRRCPDERENSEQPATVVSSQDQRVAFRPGPR